MHVPGQHVGDRLEAAMRMLGETGDVVVGTVGAELVQQQEWIEHVQPGLADDAFQLHAGTVGRVGAADAAGDVAIAHGVLRQGMMATKMALSGCLSKPRRGDGRSEEHTSELQSLMRISYAVFCLKKKKTTHTPSEYTAT